MLSVADILAPFDDPNCPHLAHGTLVYQQQYKSVCLIAEAIFTHPLATDYFQRLVLHTSTHSHHGTRVGHMWEAILSDRAREELNEKTARAGALHDIGKLYIQKAILEGGKLNPEEHREMEAHNELSVRVLRLLEPDFPDCSVVFPMHHPTYARTSQERRQDERRTIHITLPIEIDYRKHPERRIGERRIIPSPALLEAGKLLEIADVYDAMASERSYKPAWPAEQIRTKMKDRFPNHHRVIEFLLGNYSNGL